MHWFWKWLSARRALGDWRTRFDTTRSPHCLAFTNPWCHFTACDLPSLGCRAGGLKAALRSALAIAIIGNALPSLAQSPPTTPDDVVLWARESLDVTTHATLTLGLETSLTSGQVVVNDPGGVFLLRSLFRGLTGTQIIADQVIAQPSAFGKPEVFDLFTNTLDGGSGVLIDGQGPIPVHLPLFTFPAVPIVTPGTDSCPTPGRTAGDCVVRLRDGQVTIQPGNYNAIRVKRGGLLYFTGGTYNMNLLRTARNASLLFAAPTTLNIATTARFGFRSVVSPQYPDQLNGRCIVFNVAGDKVAFQPWADVTATVSAPAANMQMGQFGVFRGNFTANTARVRLGATLEAAPALPVCD